MPQGIPVYLACGGQNETRPFSLDQPQSLMRTQGAYLKRLHRVAQIVLGVGRRGEVQNKI